MEITSKKTFTTNWNTTILQEENTIIDTIEKAIQKANQLPITVAHTGSQIATQNVMARYRAQGWNVEYFSDQRDGDYLKLS